MYAEVPCYCVEFYFAIVTGNLTSENMKISIITATYNSASTLRDTIGSVLAQTYQDIEYIIVDGASKDDTLDIIHHYEPLFNGRLKYVSEPDKGLYDAMNKGIDMATGDAVGVLNSDDFFTHKDVIKGVAEALSDEQIDAVYGDVHYVNAERLDKCVRYYSSKRFRPWWMRLGFMPAHPSFYCRREVYKAYGKFDTSYRVAADFEQLLRLIFVRKIHTKYLNEDFVTMRTGGVSNANLNSRWLIMLDHRRALRANNVGSSYFLLSLRYIYKAIEVILSRFHRPIEVAEYVGKK